MGKVDDLGIDAEFGLPGDFLLEVSCLLRSEGNLDVGALTVVGIDARGFEEVIVKAFVEEVAGLGNREDRAWNPGAAMVAQAPESVSGGVASDSLSFNDGGFDTALRK